MGTTVGANLVQMMSLDDGDIIIRVLIRHKPIDVTVHYMEVADPMHYSRQL